MAPLSIAYTARIAHRRWLPIWSREKRRLRGLGMEKSRGERQKRLMIEERREERGEAFPLG
jgi:hypothetical protein